MPAGFSRVYVHQPKGFSYEGWLDGLKKGRSFVTTGPMLLAKVNGEMSGTRIKLSNNSGTLEITGEILSERPPSIIEVVVNGSPVQLVRGRCKATPEGGRHTTFTAKVNMEASGWLCVRSYEEFPAGRLRFAHTAPWHVTVLGKPLRIPPAEKEYFVGRVQTEIDRSKGIVSKEAMAEYTAALEHFQNLLEAKPPIPEARVADPKLKGWLENMVAHHQFTPHEVRAATGLPLATVNERLAEWKIATGKLLERLADAPIKVLPYPGGRHPRIGFLDGALVPQRETKVSVFTPWNPHHYVVVDVPEAVCSNLGLTYLAHTHIPTVWDKLGKKLFPLEWTANPDASFRMLRTLPNGILIGSRVSPHNEIVQLKLWIRNGSPETITGLRAQVCVMLKGLPGFNQRIRANKIIDGNWLASRDADGQRWVITGWQPLHRPWENPPVPCMHADPAFPDCPPGQTVEAIGILAFHEGSDVMLRIRELQTKHFDRNQPE